HAGRRETRQPVNGGTFAPILPATTSRPGSAQSALPGCFFSPPTTGSLPDQERLPASSVVAVADEAVVHRNTAVVVEEVGPEQGQVVEHGAVLDRQRPGSTVEDAAAVGRGVAGQRALLDVGRAEVVDAAAAIAGGVAREGAAPDIQRPEGGVVDAAALSG